MNNILAIIASGTRMLKRTDIVNKDVLARITEAVAQGHDLVSQLLSFAKSQALDIGTISIADRIERLKPLMRQAAGPGNQHFRQPRRASKFLPRRPGAVRRGNPELS